MDEEIEWAQSKDLKKCGQRFPNSLHIPSFDRKRRIHSWLWMVCKMFWINMKTNYMKKSNNDKNQKVANKESITAKLSSTVLITGMQQKPFLKIWICIFFKRNIKMIFWNQMGIWFLTPWILMKWVEMCIVLENFQAIFSWLSLFLGSAICILWKHFFPRSQKN